MKEIIIIIRKDIKKNQNNKEFHEINLIDKTCIIFYKKKKKIDILKIRRI